MTADPTNRSDNPDTGRIGVSPTAVDVYVECPRRYRYRFVEKRPVDFPPGWHLAFGSAVHTAIAAGFVALADGVDRTVARRVAGDRLVDAYDDDAHDLSLATYVDAETALDRTFDDTSPLASIVDGRTVVEVEQFHNFEIVTDDHDGDALTIDVSTRIDLVVSGERDTVIVDHKTGRRPAVTARTLQSGTYAIAVARQYGRASRFAFWFPLDDPVGTLVGTDVDAALVDLARRQLVETARKIAADTTFDPIPGWRCESCEWRRTCPIGPEHSQIGDES